MPTAQFQPVSVCTGSPDFSSVIVMKLDRTAIPLQDVICAAENVDCIVTYIIFYQIIESLRFYIFIHVFAHFLPTHEGPVMHLVSLLSKQPGHSRLLPAILWKVSEMAGTPNE